MRHPSWDKFTSELNKVTDTYGGSVYDKRNGKVWDCGQAVCAEAYGPDWMNNDRFKAVDAKGDSEPVPGEAWVALGRLVNGQTEWARPHGR